jgi:hypothetical protein
MVSKAKHRRLLGRMALGAWAALVAVMFGSGVAAASPPAVDDPAPAPPFDPSALLNAVSDYSALLPLLTGGQSFLPGMTDTAAAMPGLTDPAATPWLP